MIRNLKVLGLAVVAMLAMSAVAASAASAEGQLRTTGGAASVTLTGSQVGTHVFKANGNEVTCTTATFHGTAANGAGELTITPTYANCHIIFGFTFNANVTTNNCKYTFTTPTTTGQLHPAVEWHGDVDVTGCNAGSGLKIEVPAAGCTITVTNQGPLGTIDYENVTGSNPMDVNVRATVAGISFHSTGGLCGASAANGTYTGNTTVKADNTATGLPEGITIEH